VTLTLSWQREIVAAEAREQIELELEVTVSVCDRVLSSEFVVVDREIVVAESRERSELENPGGFNS
jgi:hypothetical protein